MAPELFNTGGGKSGLSTYGSDIFALGMVSFEVSAPTVGDDFATSKHIVPSSRCSPDKCRSQRAIRGEL